MDRLLRRSVREVRRRRRATASPSCPRPSLARSTSSCRSLRLLRLGCRPFHLIVPSPRLSAPAPVRSTGASNALQELAPVVNALASSVLVVDADGRRAAACGRAAEDPGRRRACTDDLQRAPRSARAAAAGRGAGAESACRHAHAEDGAGSCASRSAAGTDLTIRLEGARVGGVWGYTSKPGHASRTGRAGCASRFPLAGSVNGQAGPGSG